MWNPLQIQHAPEYTADISALFTRVLELIDKDLEHVAAALKLFESYTILGGRSFIRSYAPRFPLFFSQVCVTL